MKELIIGERCSGKTTRLIKKSIETGAHIFVANNHQATWIVYQAKQMGYFNIPKPITARQFMKYMKGQTCDMVLMDDARKNGILIDELDIVLHAMFKDFEIKAATVTYRKNISVMEKGEK